MTHGGRSIRAAVGFTVAATLLLAAPTGCFWNRGKKEQKAQAPRAAPAPIPLTVDSRYREDVTVYVLRGTQRTRLGVVTALTTQAFLLPATFSADAGGFRLVADPAGSRRVSFTSESVVAQPGQRLVWTLESRLGRSVLGVY
jgi:hypothetical protein